MQVGAADGGLGYPHDGVTGRLDLGDRAIDQRDLADLGPDQGFHGVFPRRDVEVLRDSIHDAQPSAPPNTVSALTAMMRNPSSVVVMGALSAVAGALWRWRGVAL